MPARRLSWSQLKPGLTILGLAIATAGVILAFGRVGSPRGPTYRIYVLANEARGIIRGTEVWLAGEKVGQVREVEFRPVSADTLGRLIIALDVERRARDVIRRDSRVEFRRGGTPIGAPIVAIAVGSPHSPAALPNDTLLMRAPQVDPDSIRAALTAAAARIPVLLRDARTLGSGFRRALGRSEPASGEMRPSLDALSERATRLSERLGRGQGTLPRLLEDRALAARARSAAAHADSLLRAASSGEGTLGRARGDSALLRALTDAQREIAAIRTHMDREDGTAGRLAHDGALERQLRLLDANLRAALADAGRDPARWLGF